MFISVFIVAFVFIFMLISVFRCMFMFILMSLFILMYIHMYMNLHMYIQVVLNLGPVLGSFWGLVRSLGTRCKPPRPPTQHPEIVQPYALSRDLHPPHSIPKAALRLSSKQPSSSVSSVPATQTTCSLVAFTSELEGLTSKTLGRCGQR